MLMHNSMLKCPFCNGDVVVDEDYCKEYLYNFILIMCLKCGINVVGYKDSLIAHYTREEKNEDSNKKLPSL